MTMRYTGPFNGALPQSIQNQIVAFMRNPSAMPYLRYTQFVPSPSLLFYYWKANINDVQRLVDVNKFAWGYGDYAPTGRDFNLQFDTDTNKIERWAFPYTLPMETPQTWNQSGIDIKNIFDQTRLNHAMLHRAKRVITSLTGASWGSNTATLKDLMGSSANLYFDDSSGVELIGGLPNPKFQLIKKALQVVKRRLHLATNGAVSGKEMICILPPAVAQVWSASGEMFEALKQSQYAKELTDPIAEDWNLPPRYAGFSLVVEDTPQVFINQHADGTVASVTTSSEQDYMLNTDTILFVSRPGGLDGAFGAKSFSTVQCFNYNGEAQVEAFTKQSDRLIEGRVVLEDKVVIPTTVSGFALTDVLA